MAVYGPGRRQGSWNNDPCRQCVISVMMIHKVYVRLAILYTSSWNSQSTHCQGMAVRYVRLQVVQPSISVKITPPPTPLLQLNWARRRVGSVLYDLQPLWCGFSYSFSSGPGQIVRNQGDIGTVLQKSQIKHLTILYNSYLEPRSRIPDSANT